MPNVSIGRVRSAGLAPGPSEEEAVFFPSLSLPQLRIFLSFLGDVLGTVRSELALEASQKTRFIYLLDFDVIYTYIAPFLRATAASASLADYKATADFFDEINEDFGLPLGTLLEVSRFLRRQVEGVRHLYAASLSTSLDAAITNMQRYLVDEEYIFAGVNSGGSDESRLLNTQMEAVKLLADSEFGMKRLHSILTHPRLFNVFDLIARHPFTIHKSSYPDLLPKLKDIRQGKAQRHANLVDAHNLSFVDSLNRHMSLRSKDGKLSPPLFFRLLTNTSALYQLGEHQEALSVRFRLQVPGGHILELLEGTEEAVAKRVFRRVHEKAGPEEIINVAASRHDAEIAVDRLVHAANEERQSVDKVFMRLHDPKNNSDRELLLRLQKPLRDLSTFFRPSPHVIRSLLDRAVDRAILPSSVEDRRYVLPERAAANLTALERLIGSVQRVLSEVDTLGFELTPIQRGDEKEAWRNPVMSLKNLGYQDEVRDHGRFKRWNLVDRNSARIALSVDAHPGHWSIQWPTEVAVDLALKVLRDALLRSYSADTLAVVTVIEHNSPRRKEKTTVGNLLVPGLLFEHIVFVRVDVDHQSFVSELFALNSGHSLRTGMLTSDPNVDLLSRLVGDLTRERSDFLFKKLVVPKLFKLMTTDWTDLEEN